MKKIFDARKALRYVFLALLVVSVAFYALYQTRVLRSGPQITLTSPLQNEVVADPLLVVSGSADNLSFITLNDRQIFLNPEGEFREEILLYPGYNRISIKVQDKFKRVRTLERFITLSGNTLPSLASLEEKELSQNSNSSEENQDEEEVLLETEQESGDENE